MTALDVLVEERLAERAFVLGEFFRTAVRDLKSPLVKEVRGRGLLNAIVIDEAYSKKQGKGRTAWQFCLLLKSRGVLAKPTHVNMSVHSHARGLPKVTHFFFSVRFAPPLVIEEADLREAVKIIGECLADLNEVSSFPVFSLCVP